MQRWIRERKGTQAVNRRMDEGCETVHQKEIQDKVEKEKCVHGEQYWKKRQLSIREDQ